MTELARSILPVGNKAGAHVPSCPLSGTGAQLQATIRCSAPGPRFASCPPAKGFSCRWSELPISGAPLSAPCVPKAGATQHSLPTKPHLQLPQDPVSFSTETSLFPRTACSSVICLTAQWKSLGSFKNYCCCCATDDAVRDSDRIGLA